MKEETQNKGIKWLYHVTDEANLSSILENMCICSWADMNARHIAVCSPGGNVVTHALDKRCGMDSFVHLYINEPSEHDLEMIKATGLVNTPIVLRVSSEAINDSTIFTIGNLYDPDGKKAELSQILSDGCPAGAMAHIRSLVPTRYIDNIPDSYFNKVSSLHPTALIFIIDHSESMSRSTDLNGRRYDYMSDAVAEAVNGQIDKLLEKSKDENGSIQDKYDIAVIGYGKEAYSAWSGDLKGRGFVHMSEIAKSRGADAQFPWVDSRDDGSSSHCEKAMKMAYELLEEWMKAQSSPYYYPPIVVHITDGDVNNDCKLDFIRYAEKIKKERSADGNVILWNLNITPFRLSEFVLPNGAEISALYNTGLELYEASSILPDAFNKEIAAIKGDDDDLPHRALGVNVSVDTMSKLIDMSTTFIKR
jgi:von Willebrand factor type A domain.